MSVISRKFAAKSFPWKTRTPVPMSYYVARACKTSVLKTAWYSVRFRGVVLVGRGSKIRVHRSAHVSLASKSVLAIGIGHDAPVGAVLRLSPRSNLRVSGRVQISRDCNVALDYDATLTIGGETIFNEGCSVSCYSDTTIGSGCAISWGVRILDSDIHKLLRDGETTPRAPSPHAPINIGKDCWVGANAVVLKGTQLGDGSVVAAGAVVASKVPPSSLVAGVPARVVRENVTWAL